MIIGETSTFSILIDFKEETRATEEFANQLFGQLDNYSVELDGVDRPSNGLGLHKMRSVESITASQSGELHDDPSTLPARSAAIFVNNTRIVIPITAKIDSEASFERAHALLKFNIYEERADETLRKYLDEPRAGSRLLRKLLQDEPLTQSGSIVELIKSVNVRVPLYRPLQASINYVKKSDCAMLISVQLSCNEILQETFTIQELHMSLGDFSSHSTTNHGFDKQIFRVDELAVPLPVDMQAGEVYGCVFEVTLLPYAELRLRDEHKEMKVHLDATITLTDRSTPLQVSFESEIFVNNGSEQEVDLTIRMPLEALTRPIRTPASEDVFVTTEQMIDIYYSEYEHRTPAFLPLVPETVMGIVCPGECATVSVRLLPVREGLHTIKRLVITDNRSNREFEVSPVLQIRAIKQ